MNTNCTQTNGRATRGGRITLGSAMDQLPEGCVAPPGAAHGMSRREFALGALSCSALALAVGTAAAFADEPPAMPADGGQGGPGGEDGQDGTPPDGGQPGADGLGGADTMTFDYQGTYQGVFEANGESASAAGTAIDAPDADVNAVLAQNAGTAEVANCVVSKSGDDTDGDACNFYGVNSIALAVNEGSAVYLDGCTLTADGEGSNGVFATDGAQAFANGCAIVTSAGNSRGLDATYGGMIVAAGMDIHTQGDHCAAVATDRGGGSISVTDSTLATEGSGSPLLYSTGNIQVCGVSGTSAGSQIAGMEGLNTILVKDSRLTSTNTGLTGSDPVANGVIIYQSTSGDAEVTTGDAATFQAVDSTLSSAVTAGALFYFTNTSASVVLKNTQLDFDDTAAQLVYAAGNDANNWGQAGGNGAQVTFTGRAQVLAGNVTADTISAVSMFLLDGTTWTGAAGIEQNAAGSTSEAPVVVNVDATSTWVVTADSEVSALNVVDGGMVVDEVGGTVSIVVGGKTVVSGTSAVTVTVDGAYGTSVSTTEANELATEVIDRSTFDEHFGVSTSWQMGSAATGAAASSQGDA